MAVSFAIFVPILVLISVAILEFASVGLDYHRAGEATRRGARLATILPPVANLSTLQPSAEVVCTAGDTVPSCSGAASIRKAASATQRRRAVSCRSSKCASAASPMTMPCSIPWCRA
jgi:Flp pilus assembly protein TadG